MNPKTDADRLFEAWMCSSGHTDFEYEADLGPGSAPDYCVRADGTTVLCEVKGFAPPDLTLGFSQADFRTPIREKVNAAQKQFRRFRGTPCVLVLANGAFIDHPKQMAQVMFGDFEFLIPARVRPGAELPPPIELRFGSGGKMRHGRSDRPQNTTISAILALWYPRRNLLGAIVYENPAARSPLPRTIFSGPYDLRYGETQDENWGLVSCGRLLPPDSIPEV